MLALKIQAREVTKLLNQFDHAAIIKAIGTNEALQLIIDEMGGLNAFVRHFLNEYPVDIEITDYVDQGFRMDRTDYSKRG